VYITVSTLYDDRNPRNVVAVQYQCGACGEMWEHQPLSAALKAVTSSPFDRQCRQHWSRCAGKPR
jgi:hypothetical protein